MGERTVGVFPGGALASRPRLFAALATAFDAQIVDGTGCAPDHVSAAVVIDDPALSAQGGAATSVTELARRGVQCLLMGPSGPSESSRRIEVRFGSPSLLDNRLWNRTLHEEAVAAPPLAAREGDVVVATGPDGPLWVCRRVGPGVMQHVARAPVELAPGDRLKDHLRAGRFLSLLPVVHFLRDTLGGPSWSPPPRRASLVVDDPNLHWPSYGYLRYPELAAHVARHGYHLGIAMVPVDAAFAHPAAVATLRSNVGLSLVVHGNDHRKFELTQPRSSEAALALAAQALRRMAAFERRQGVTVERVMVPPHARCSEQMMRAVRAVGFEAICYGGEGQDLTGDALAGWATADTSGGEGLPRMRRVGFSAPIDELVLRAFLDQPLVLSGHHADLADLDRLAAAAALVEGLGPVQWMSLGGLSRTNVATRREGQTLRLRAFSRRMVVDLPEEVEHVVVEVPSSPWSPEDRVGLRAGGDRGPGGGVGERLGVAGPGPVEVSLRRPDDVDPVTVPTPPWRPWPIVRRCMTEGRDRLLPLLPGPGTSHRR